MMVRFTIAAALFVLFLVGFEPNLTGNRIHEWPNLVLGAGIVIHLVSDWDWIVAVVRRSILRSPAALRIKSAVDVLLALTFVVLLLSGLMISQSVLGNRMPAPRHSV